MREKAEWSQQELADKIGSNQNAVYRAENPNYGRQTLSTLRKIAAAFDVGLIVRFAAFGELVDWTTTTPHLVEGLTSAALAPANFKMEESASTFSVPSFDLVEPAVAKSGHGSFPWLSNIQTLLHDADTQVYPAYPATKVTEETVGGSRNMTARFEPGTEHQTAMGSTLEGQAAGAATFPDFGGNNVVPIDHRIKRIPKYRFRGKGQRRGGRRKEAVAV